MIFAADYAFFFDVAAAAADAFRAMPPLFSDVFHMLRHAACR